MKKDWDDTLPASKEGLYPIRTVSEVTGVNAITLRAWERRYGLFKPERTPKGHRLYSQEDILRIQHVLQLLENGLSIGRAAKALKDEIEPENLVDFTAKNDGLVSSGELAEANQGQWKLYHDALLSYVNTYDLAQLEQLHREIFSLYPLDIISKNLLYPVLEELKHEAKKLQSLSGSYHFYWHFLQQRIANLFLKSVLQNRGKKILLVGHGEKQADIELMLYGMSLVSLGYRIVFLGCDISFDAIPMVLSRSNSDALIVYKASQAAPHDLEVLISIGVVANSLKLAFFLAGQYTDQQVSDLKEKGLKLLSTDMVEQRRQLEAVTCKA